MSNLETKIKEDLKQAMQAKNELAVSVLRLLISSLRNKEISLRQNNDIELSEEQAMEVVASEIKKRRDSISAYEQAGRQELADKEKAELEILSGYLPAQADAAEIEAIVKEIVDNAPDKNFGKIMGQAMARLKGKADGNLVGEIVKKLTI